MNGSDDVLPVSPRRHWVGVAVCQPGAVVVATSVPRHVTKDIRMLRRHVGQRNSQRRRSVHRQSQLELHMHAASVYRYLTTVLPAMCQLYRLFGGQSVEGISLVCYLSTDQLSREPYGRAHSLVETRKTLTADEYLADVFLHQKDLPVVSTVNFDANYLSKTSPSQIINRNEYQRYRYKYFFLLKLLNSPAVT